MLIIPTDLFGAYIKGKEFAIDRNWNDLNQANQVESGWLKNDDQWMRNNVNFQTMGDQVNQTRANLQNTLLRNDGQSIANQVASALSPIQVQQAGANLFGTQLGNNAQVMQNQLGAMGVEVAKAGQPGLVDNARFGAETAIETNNALRPLIPKAGDTLFGKTDMALNNQNLKNNDDLLTFGQMSDPGNQMQRVGNNVATQQGIAELNNVATQSAINQANMRNSLYQNNGAAPQNIVDTTNNLFQTAIAGSGNTNPTQANPARATLPNGQQVSVYYGTDGQRYFIINGQTLTEQELMSQLGGQTGAPSFGG